MNEIIWAGLMLEARSLAAEAFTRLTAGRQDEYGSRTIAHYDIQGTDVVVISVEGSRVGIGILCNDETEAKDKVAAAHKVLANLNIPGTVSGWKMYNLPKAA